MSKIVDEANTEGLSKSRREQYKLHISFTLPEIDSRYRLIHCNDKPFMCYPGEMYTQVENLLPQLSIYITSYGRVYNETQKKWYNDGQPVNKYALTVTYKRQQYTINVFAAVKNMWPDSPYLNIEHKKPLTKEQSQAFDQWYVANNISGLLDSMDKSDVSDMYYGETGIRIHPQTIYAKRNSKNKQPTSRTRAMVSVTVAEPEPQPEEELDDSIFCEY